MVLVAAITVFLIRTFVVQPFLVSGASMEHTFIDGDYVLVDEISYRFQEPQRGDVVVFRYPLNPSLFYIKRVIGIPGDHLEVNNNHILVNGEVLNEPYLDLENRTLGGNNLILKDGEIFAVGDNRLHSYDSRSWGTVPYENIIGVVKLRLLPALTSGVIERPDYN